MTIYIFNSYLEGNYGFARRCRRMIEILSKRDDLMVICRSEGIEKEHEYQSGTGKVVKIFEYSNSDELVNNKASVMPFIEISRNIRLVKAILAQMLKVKSTYKKSDSLHLVVVSSPITVPFLLCIVGKLFGFKPLAVEFHDLEPELTMHIKKVSKDSIIVKVTYWMEKLVVLWYPNIIVTTEAQKEKIVSRTGISGDKTKVIPNLVAPVVSSRKINHRLAKELSIQENDIVLMYSSSFTLDYSVDGLLTFLDSFPIIEKSKPNIKFLIIGRGEKTFLIEEKIKEKKLKNVIFLKDVKNVDDYIQLADVGFVPWQRTEMTETMMPTKVYEFGAFGKPVLAPNFGEFKELITQGKNGILFNAIKDLPVVLKNLDKNNLDLLGEEFYTSYKKYYQIVISDIKLN